MNTASRIDATCVITATTIAACGALGWTPEWFPVPLEQLGVAADLGAGCFWGRHKLQHWLEHRRKEPVPAVVSIRTDNAGRVTWTQ